MDYVISFSDVMAGVITLGLGVITFFIKGWIGSLKSSTEEIKKQIKENDDKVNKRIDKLEEETDEDIANIKQELNNIKGDFATTFVLREDFFRSMNGLLNKVATAEEEFNEMPLDKAGRLIASLSRTKVYKDRVKQDMRRKADIAFREMESEMLKVIKQDGKSAEMLKEILAKAKERMMEDD